jgi:hypothetical protein
VPPLLAIVATGAPAWNVKRAARVVDLLMSSHADTALALAARPGVLRDLMAVVCAPPPPGVPWAEGPGGPVAAAVSSLANAGSSAFDAALGYIPAPLDGTGRSEPARVLCAAGGLKLVRDALRAAPPGRGSHAGDSLMLQAGAFLVHADAGAATTAADAGFAPLLLPVADS